MVNIEKVKNMAQIYFIDFPSTLTGSAVCNSETFYVSRYLTALKVFYLHHSCAKKHLVLFILNFLSAAFV